MLFYAFLRVNTHTHSHARHKKSFQIDSALKEINLILFDQSKKIVY